MSCGDCDIRMRCDGDIRFCRTRENDNLLAVADVTFRFMRVVFHVIGHKWVST